MSKKALSVLLVAAGLLGLAATRTLVQGTVTVALPEPMGIGSDMLNQFLYPIDVNADGLTDFTFAADPAGVALRTERANRVVYRIAPPPNLGGLVARLEEGFEIGSSLEPSLGWRSSDLVGGYVSPGEIAFATIAMHLSSGTLSEWPNSPGARGFIGVQLELDDGFHFGYFDVRMAAEGGGRLYGWAYNSIPNAPIIARPVPEPSTWALLIGGGILMLWFRHNRSAGGANQITGANSRPASQFENRPCEFAACGASQWQFGEGFRLCGPNRDVATGCRRGQPAGLAAANLRGGLVPRPHQE